MILEGGAAVAAGNEPFGVHGGGSSALSLPAGSSATSPVSCIDLNYPTFRFMAVQEQAAADARLEVEVIYPDSRPRTSAGRPGTSRRRSGSSRRRQA